MKNKKQIVLAEQQFLGYALGSQGHSINELCSSMGLKKEEWDYLKKERMVNTLTKEQIEEVNKIIGEEE